MTSPSHCSHRDLWAPHPGTACSHCSLASLTTTLLLTPAPLPAPWPVDSAREVYEAPFRPAPQPRSTDASTIESCVITRHPACTVAFGHRS
ncbi:hypothetical protein NDU88_005721 [Pleurodeles waltl]|uniref:Secreted protein n=1 Tax=Pleurodeles waltl TaxID=8319 RepID=A0AAV7NNB6_PLEWA|nr:hypothetical protein NDU88_005721 [Pleurodeles waltl]